SSPSRTATSAAATPAIAVRRRYARRTCPPLARTPAPGGLRELACWARARRDLERELDQAASAAAASVAGPAPARCALPAGDKAHRRRLRGAARGRAVQAWIRAGAQRRGAVEWRGDPVPYGRRGHGRRPQRHV